MFDAADAPAEALAPALEEKNTDGVPLSEGVGNGRPRETWKRVTGHGRDESSPGVPRNSRPGAGMGTSLRDASQDWW